MFNYRMTRTHNFWQIYCLPECQNCVFKIPYQAQTGLARLKQKQEKKNQGLSLLPILDFSRGRTGEKESVTCYRSQEVFGLYQADSGTVSMQPSAPSLGPACLLLTGPSSGGVEAGIRIGTFFSKARRNSLIMWKYKIKWYVELQRLTRVSERVSAESGDINILLVHCSFYIATWCYGTF